MATPDFSQFFEMCCGWPPEFIGGYAQLLCAANIAVGTNPPYSLAEFTASYPQFLGPGFSSPAIATGTDNTLDGVVPNAGIIPGVFISGPGIPAGAIVQTVATVLNTSQSCTTTQGSNALTAIASTAGMLVGMPISGIGIPAGATITGVGMNSLLLSAVATASASLVALAVSSLNLVLTGQTTVSGSITVALYVAPIVPVAILNAYIFAASSSLQFARWLEVWNLGMGLYIAHYATLFCQTSSFPAGAQVTAARVAAAGLQTGILTSQSADGVSMGSTPVPGLEEWGAYNLTTFGTMFATFAKAIGSGPMQLY